MRMPGFTAEKSLGKAVHQYRAAAAGAGADAARQSVQAAVIGGGTGREVTPCRDCDGTAIPCSDGICVRVCTRNGGYAYCQPKWW
jgi:hypothetical protein